MMPSVHFGLSSLVAGPAAAAASASFNTHSCLTFTLRRWPRGGAARVVMSSDNKQYRPPPSTPGFTKRQSSIGVTLLGLGCCIGPLLDGIHSNVQLQVYENGALNLGPLQTNLVVPPLLAVFYAVVGLSQLALDEWLAPKDWIPRTSLSRLVFSFMFLIIFLELSSEMYKAGTPYNIEAYILFALAELNWYLFDGTWWGFGLASVVGVLCPLSEVPLMKYFDVWHYPKANVAVFDEGLVTWVLACYFAYVPFLANLSRWLDFRSRMQENDLLNED